LYTRGSAFFGLQQRPLDAFAPAYAGSLGLMTEKLNGEIGDLSS
jgi:hypothetical protein